MLQLEQLVEVAGFKVVQFLHFIIPVELPVDN